MCLGGLESQTAKEMPCLVNPNQEIEGLMFKFREACIYTWINVNLNFAE